MANETLAEDLETLSQTVTAPTPTWAPPRFPLPPHRLAALANALGVSTPLPATHSFTCSSSFSGSIPSSDHNWRSPTPSTTYSFNSYSSPSSKFLLHVMPPLHLPHDSNSATENSELTPPPSNASGYHTQFRRGTLVPLQATLQSQMVAIAKEYALPSTSGMILYLASAPTTRSAQPSPTPSSPANGDNAEEPGPRISEDIWKHIWARVLKVEREEHLAASRSPTPNFGLGIGLGVNNSTYLTQDMNSHVQPLRPMFSPSLRGPIAQVSPPSAPPVTPSPSTSSSTDLRSNSVSKSIAPSFSSRSHSEPQTPATSSADEQELDLRGKNLHLPGLDSPSIIPILAKVEFDIDKRKAGWYEPWVRSRKRNHLKRLGSKKVQLSGDEKVAPIQLELAGRIMEGEYKPLSESPEHTDAEADPLEEVFGTDADTWADMHADSQSPEIVQHQNPNVVQLALNGAELSALPDEGVFDQDNDQPKDEDEVMELLEKMNRPQLSISIPSSPTFASHRKSSPTTAGSLKKPIPPPLVLSDLPADDSQMHGNTTHLPYLVKDTAGDETFTSDDSISRQRIHEEKRDGGVFDDLDLGLGDYTYDENDPHDRRKSQFIMKAKLDEIERALAQFSPNRIDHTESEDDLPSPSIRSGTSAISSSGELQPKQDEAITDRSSSLKPKHHTVRIENAQGKARLNEEIVPSAPGWSELSLRKKQNRNTFKLEGSTFPRDSAEAEASWSVVPLPSAGSSNGAATSIPSADILPSRPTVKGVSTASSKSAVAKPRSLHSKDVVSSESLIWTRTFEEKTGPSSPPGPLRKGSSPIIPLSPDPFGRFSSDTKGRSRNIVSVESRSTPSRHKVAMSHSSRFSSDSIPEDGDAIPKVEKGSTSLVGVKSVKRLWRKSKKLSISGAQALTGAGRSSPNPPPLPGSAKELSMLPPPRSPLPSPDPSASTPPVRHTRVDSAFDHFHFDQESPYPLHKAARPSISERPLSQGLPSASGPNGESVHKSILKPWKAADIRPQLQGAMLEPRPSTERRPSGEAPRPSTDEPVRPKRPSVLDIVSSLGASSSPDFPPPSPRPPVQYIQNGRVSGLSERRKSRPKVTPTSSTDSSHHSPPPTRPVLLSTSTSPPRSMMSASSRDSEDTRPSFDVSQFEIVSPKINSSLSYPYHALDHDGQ